MRSFDLVDICEKALVTATYVCKDIIEHVYKHGASREAPNS